MAVQRYKIALNNAKFPLVSSWGERSVLVPSMDVASRATRGFQGSEVGIDFNVPQILYGENFLPTTNGVKSVSYKRIIPPTVNSDFNQVFPLRDAEEKTVLYSPAGGKSYIHDAFSNMWTSTPINTVLTTEYNPGFVFELLSTHPNEAKVTRAYVDGKTYVAYSRMYGHNTATPTPFDLSLFFWDTSTTPPQLIPVGPGANTSVVNLPFPAGEIDGIAGANGYLIVWSGLEVAWAPFNGTAFDFEFYANGEVTGAGRQIPEDLQGPITAIIPVAGGFIIFTTKNAVAAFYNANNFASPWIFRLIANAGGIESYEQATVEGNLGSIYAYTTGGLQKISLNQAENDAPDVTDFLGGRFIETFNTTDLTFERAASGSEFFTKITYCGQRFLVVSYGFMPGLYSFALIFDASLKRWGKLRLVHRDCFSYSYGSQAEDVTYNMLHDVSYDETDPLSYDEYVIQSGNLIYPRQSIAFLLATGEVKLAVTDYRAADDDSEAFVVLGKNQLSRARLSTVQEVEIEGIRAGGQCSILRSVNGATYSYPFEPGFLREQDEQFAEFGFDNVTGKNFSIYVKGDFALTSVIIHASNDGSF